MNSRKNHLMSLLALSGLAACSGAPPYAALPIEDDPELVSNVVVSDPDLYDAIRVGRAGVERVAGSNQLKVAVPIRNISDGTVQVRVQTSFLDLAKQPIGDETNQQVQILSPGATVTHTAMSATAAARDWTMRIFPNSR
ncbi:MAG: hypothetical protein VYD05_10760 [Planctomycetota bacterium]|nr:hypothetical protein [Planctomycetota bacterium]MEC8253253.1 hypothetical protein [Planctomycetota bacterium]